MIVGQIRGQQMAEMPVAEDDHVVETLAPEGPDQPLRIRILPRAGRTGDHLADPHAGDAAPEHIAVDGVAISEQPSRRRVLRKRFNHLLRRPRRCGVFRDVEMNDSPTLMAEQDQDEQHAAGEGGHGEEVHTRPVRVGTVKKSIDTSVAT